MHLRNNSPPRPSLLWRAAADGRGSTRILARAALAAALAAPAAPAWAEDYLSAAGLGAGSASLADGREIGNLNRAPAVLALEERYDLTAGVRLGVGKDLRLQAAARDARTGPIALGLGATWRRATPPTDPADLPGWALPDADQDNPISSLGLAGGLAGAWLDRRLSAGLSVERVATSSRLSDPEVLWDGTLSVAGRPAAPLTLAVSGQHLLGLFLDQDDPGPRLAFGGRWVPSSFLGISAEGAAPLAGNGWGWATGAEAWLADSHLPLRVGVERDPDLGTRFVSAGLGFRSEKYALDYAWRRDVGADGGAVDETGIRTWHVLSFQLLL